MKVLRIESSARKQGSISRRLTQAFIDGLGPDAEVEDLELLEMGLGFVDEPFMEATRVPAEERTPEQQELVALSDRLCQQLFEVDAIVIGAPVYNYGVPAVLKAYIDLVNRAGVTFRYGAHGLETMVPSKPVVVCVATGGTPVGSEMELTTKGIQFGLGGIGLTDQHVFSAVDPRAKPDDLVVAEEEALRAFAKSLLAS